MVSKALIKLTTNDPFFGCIAMRLNVEPVDEHFMKIFKSTRGFDFTMATDGKSLKYSPDWVAQQQLNDLVGVLAHEAAHVALKHNVRRGARDINKWNIACDLAINGHLVESGYSLPGYDDDAKKQSLQQYTSMSAEKIYATIPDGPPGGQNPPPQGQNPPPPGGDGGGSAPEPDKNQNQQKQDPWQNAPQPPGGILDHPELNPKNPNSQKEIEEQQDGEIEAAYNAAKMAGNTPGWVDRLIKGRRKVITDYRELLRDWMEKSIFKGDYSWSVPNRRYIPHGFCLPGFAPELDEPNIIFVMDTSGSIGDEEEEEFASHINSVLEEFPSSYTIIFTDTRVRGRQEISHDDLPIELQTKGGGGTNFSDVMRVIKEEYVKSDRPPQGVLFFTDMETGSFGDDPGIPVLWLVHSVYGDNTPEAPFGKVVVCKSQKQLEEENDSV
jgi:predicted metal-dependent peptidase